MAATVSAALRYVNGNLGQLLPERVILTAAREVGHRWRRRKLGPARTVMLLVLQLLCGNASLAEARALDGYRVCVAALAQARQRLPLELLRRVNAWLLEQFALNVIAADPSAPPRVLLIDAANYYLPDTAALRRRYRQPRQQKRRGNGRRRPDYPQLRTLDVFDLRSGLLLAQHDFASDRHESPQLRHVLDLIGARAGDVVIFDRGLVSYANLCLLQERGLHVVARLAKGLTARRGSRRRRRARLGKGDTLVRWEKPARRPRSCPISTGRWRQLPMQRDLRQVSVTVAGPRKGSRCRHLTLITSLLDPQTHPAAQIAAWYRRRWEIETDLRHLKSTLKLEFLRTQSVANVRRELLLRAIAYNLVRAAMLRAATLRRVEPQRVSFADACRWLRLTQAAGVSLLELLINPQRIRRPRPRKLKYRGKNYRWLTTALAPQRRVA